MLQNTEEMATASSPSAVWGRLPQHKTIIFAKETAPEATATRCPAIQHPLQNTREMTTFWPSDAINTHFCDKKALKKNTVKHEVFGVGRIHATSTPFSAIFLLQAAHAGNTPPPPVRHGGRVARGQGGRAAGVWGWAGGVWGWQGAVGLAGGWLGWLAAGGWWLAAWWHGGGMAVWQGI